GAADEVDHHAIAGLRRTIHSAVADTLATHALEHRVDVGVGDLEHGPLDLQRAYRVDHHLGHHFDHGGELQVFARLHLDRFDARAASRTQLLFRDRIAVA